ncbi:MAG TPA: hypothetical protein VGJ45_14550 [Pseudonocardiaceae bacterium]|jgi:hypothetical protein
MTDGFVVSDLEQIAALLDGGVADLVGSAAPSAPDAGGSSAAIGGVLSALRGVVGSIVGTGDAASGSVRSGHDAYRDADRNAARTFGAAHD